MKHFKRVVALLLTVCMLVTGSVIVSASGNEEYISDLRIIYADNIGDARKILQNTEFKDYKILDFNLNRTATKIDLGFITIGDSNGVYLAYKTTTDIDDAITDVSVMQMDGGYKEGNYEEMIKKSREQYELVGETYLKAIDYMIQAYYAGDFLATCAYRQLELYYDDDSEMTLGAFFETQPGADALATMFLEGNRYALKNIRALIGMGVSYNADGATYLERVSEVAKEFEADPSLYDESEHGEIADIIATSLVTFRDLIEELATVEDELNYADDEITELETKYAESQALAEMLRGTEYLNGETLYDFCLKFNRGDDHSKLYPLIAALNEGQYAVTEVGHYYDVVRYSMTVFPEEFMDEEISALEDSMKDKPYSIYTGVDRSIYSGTLALTTEAYRADISSDKGFLDSVYALSDWTRWGLEIGAGAVGAGLFIWAIVRTKHASDINNLAAASAKAYEAAANMRIALEKSIYDYMSTNLVITNNGMSMTMTPTEFLKDVLDMYCPPFDASVIDSATQSVFVEQVMYAHGYVGKMHPAVRETMEKLFNDTQDLIDKAYPADGGYSYGETLPSKIAGTSWGYSAFTVALYAVGAAMMIYAAYNYGSQVYSYYNPTLKDIPNSMVDLVVTEDGDRYIKYDAVTMVEMNEDMEYDPADLNAFGGKRWNALYYTKSYEAGKPLLAKFNVSTDNNTAANKYLPVHRFGESVCYDLNKHNFDYEDNIYLSIAQSDKEKSSIADIPDVVGTMMAGGLFFLVGGGGILVGVGVTLVVQKLKKKKTEDGAEKDTDQ